MARPARAPAPVKTSKPKIPAISTTYKDPDWARYQDPRAPLFGWFSIGDLRFALVALTFYRMLLVHPVAFCKFAYRWHAVRKAPWLALLATFVHPFHPFGLYFNTLFKCAIKRLLPSKPDANENKNGEVFFALPDGLLARVNAICYFELSYEVGAFLHVGADPSAIQHMYRDVITTKEYWFTLLDSVGANRPHQLARWEDGRITEVGPGLDAGKCDIVCKITDSYIGIGDIVFGRGKDFDLKVPKSSEISSADLLAARLANDCLYEGKIALLNEKIAPIQRERVRLSNEGFSNVHSFDILTVRDISGDIKVLSCLLWTDCRSWTTHTCTSGYVIDLISGRIVAPVPWYSFSFAKNEHDLRQSSLIGSKVPGIHTLLDQAVAAHAASDIPWLTSVGWDAMLTDNGYIFFEGNLGCGRLPRRIFFDFHSVNSWIQDYGIGNT